MNFKNIDWKSWLSLGCAIFCVFWIHVYEQNTMKLEERLENIEYLSQDTFQNVQKINCQAMYGAEACEDDFLTVPPYEDVEKVIIEVIKEHEKFTSQAYRDGCELRRNGKCLRHRYSIGYGTREKTPGEVISEEEATVRLKEHLRVHVLPYIPSNVTDRGTYIALADLGYNAGPRAIKDCVNFDGTLNVESYQKWVKANGRKNPGLEQRRKGTLIYALSIMEL